MQNDKKIRTFNLAEAIAAFNPQLTKEEAEKRAKQKTIGFTITDVTPAGYGN